MYGTTVLLGLLLLLVPVIVIMGHTHVRAPSPSASSSSASAARHAAPPADRLLVHANHHVGPTLVAAVAQTMASVPHNADVVVLVATEDGYARLRHQSARMRIYHCPYQDEVQQWRHATAVHGLEWTTPTWWVRAGWVWHDWVHMCMQAATYVPVHDVGVLRTRHDVIHWDCGYLPAGVPSGWNSCGDAMRDEAVLQYLPSFSPYGKRALSHFQQHYLSRLHVDPYETNKTLTCAGFMQSVTPSNGGLTLTPYRYADVFWNSVDVWLDTRGIDARVIQHAILETRHVFSWHRLPDRPLAPWVLWVDKQHYVPPYAIRIFVHRPGQLCASTWSLCHGVQLLDRTSALQRIDAVQGGISLSV